MKPIIVVLFLVLPLVMAATMLAYEGLTEEEIEKRMSLVEIVSLLKILDLSDGCIEVCEQHVAGFWRGLCSAGCSVVLASAR